MFGVAWLAKQAMLLPVQVGGLEPELIPPVAEIGPDAATLLGVIAPRAIVSAGVAPPDDVPDTPFAVATDTAVTLPPEPQADPVSAMAHVLPVFVGCPQWPLVNPEASGRNMESAPFQPCQFELVESYPISPFAALT